jgi:hypothetical protein
MTAVSNTQPYLEGHTAAIDKKTWNTYSPGHCGSYLPQVHPMGIRTTLRRTCSAVFESCIEPRKGWTKGGRGRKREIELRRRSSPYTTESAVIDHRRKLEEVDIDDEDKESMDKGTMSDI